MEYKIYNDDCLKVLEKIENNFVDSIITDPPYGLTSIVKRFGKDGSFARLSKKIKCLFMNGDILKYNFDGKERIDYIEYKENMFTYHNAIRWSLNKDEVIGNIFDNPDLLGE